MEIAYCQVAVIFHYLLYLQYDLNDNRDIKSIELDLEG